MIHYDNHYWGLPLLGRLYGSAFPRAFLFASLAALETALLYQFAPTYITKSLKNPTIFQIFGFVVGFALVFRSSLSYNRFWEARTMLQSVMGRLSYFTIETIAADLGSMDHDTATPEQRRAAHRFYNELLHHVSMLFGFMVKALRKDFDLSTVYKHSMVGKAPFMDSNVGIRGWNRWEVFVVRVLALNDLFEIHNPQQEAAIPIIGGLSDEEKIKLANLMPTPEMKGLGSTLNGTRPYVVFSLINQLYIRRIAEGGFQTLAPLVSRLGGIAEEGMAAFGHCYKLASTQFPFPWAQVVMAFLAIMGLLLPFVVTSFVDQLWMAITLSFIVVLTYWSLNEVASEMEDPFGFDPNDLPLARYAFDFNNGVLSAAFQLRPPYFDELDAELAAAGAAKQVAVAESTAPATLRPGGLAFDGSPDTPPYSPAVGAAAASGGSSSLYSSPSQASVGSQGWVQLSPAAFAASQAGSPAAAATFGSPPAPGATLSPTYTGLSQRPGSSGGAGGSSSSRRPNEKGIRTPLPHSVPTNGEVGSDEGFCAGAGAAGSGPYPGANASGAPVRSGSRPESGLRAARKTAVLPVLT